MDALLAAGAKPSVWEARKKQTPLHLAASKGHASCVTSLLRGGADPVATTKKGETPFDLGSHHPEVGRALRDHLDQQQQAATAAAAGAAAKAAAASVQETVATAGVAPEDKAVKANAAPAPAPDAASAAADVKPEVEALPAQQATAVATTTEAPRDSESEPLKKKAKKEKKKAKGLLSLSHLEDGDVPF